MTETGDFVKLNLDSSFLFVSKKNQAFDLDIIVNPLVLFDCLQLTGVDEELTREGLKKGAVAIPKIATLFVEKDIVMLCYRGTYIHSITNEDLAKVPNNVKSDYKLKLGNRALKSVTCYVGLDLNTLKISSCATVQSPEGFWIDQFSPCAYNLKNKNEFFVPIQPEVLNNKSITEHDLASRNFCLGRFYLKDSVLRNDSILAFLRPFWFAQLDIANDYCSGMFQIIDTSMYYYLTSYPCFFDILNSRTYAVPVDSLKTMKRKLGVDFSDKTPTLSSLGILRYDNTIMLIARVVNSGQIVGFSFDSSGEFNSVNVVSSETGAWYVDGKFLYHSRAVGNKNFIVSKCAIK